MPLASSPKRFCMIDPAGGALTVRLQASIRLAAGAAFNVLVPGGGVIESFKLSAGAVGAAQHELVTSPAALVGNGLAWNIQLCSVEARVDEGTVEVDILQDGVTCQMTIPARYHFTDVPDCEAARNNVISQKGSTRFLAG